MQKHTTTNRQSAIMPAGDSRTPALSDWQAARRRQSLVPLRSNVSESVPDGIIAGCFFEDSHKRVINI